MARLTVAAFVTKWGTPNFPSDGLRSITGARMRDFRQDIADSFYNLADNQDIKNLDTTGSNLAIDLLNQPEVSYLGSASIGGNKTATLPNATYAKEFTLHFTSGGAHTIDFPANTSMRAVYHGGIWDNTSKILTLETGDFVLQGFYNGTTWRLELYGPY